MTLKALHLDQTTTYIWQGHTRYDIPYVYMHFNLLSITVMYRQTTFNKLGKLCHFMATQRQPRKPTAI